MPCFRCGTRQTDPVRGASPWRRGVRDGAQVLVCPECQRDAHWQDELDTCPACGSAGLARALGQTRCKDCPWAEEPAAPTTGNPPVEGLAADVAAAVRRVLGRRSD